MSLQALQKRIHYEEMEVTGGEGGHSAFWFFADFLMCYGKDHSHHIPKNWQQFSCFGSIARFQDALLISYMRKLVCGGCTCIIVDCTFRSLCVRHFQPIEIGKLMWIGRVADWATVYLDFFGANWTVSHASTMRNVGAPGIGKVPHFPRATDFVDCF